MPNKLRPISELHAAMSMQFIAEQDGLPEREFKRHVRALLDRAGNVERGYLARVVYGPASSEIVALCLRAKAPQDAVVLQIADMFASMFGQEASLDILFVDIDQEQDLARLCAPFFEART